ncbi:MAG: N-formylglutamate amidohydrolase [Pseudomonadota bacterium]
MTTQAYDLTLPLRRMTSVVFASPHSGRHYPPEFLERSILDERTIRTSEDAFVDQLLDCVPGFGAPLIAARAPRSYIDLNRASDELDPALVDGVRPAGHNPRISSGLGVIPRVVSGGRAIHRGKIPLAEAEARIATWWTPYHARLQALLDETRAEFGEAVLADFHSMPHEAIESLASNGARRPDIVIGDRFGATAHPAVVERIEEAFERAGLRVMRNAPFAGAFIAQTYGRPSRRQHAVQIEMDRSLYMNEQEIRPNGNFLGFKRLLRQVLAEIAGIGRSSLPVAAE